MGNLHGELVMKTIIAWLVLVFLFPVLLFAAPGIQSVSGTVANGQSIVITSDGNNFGATGPVVHLFDDFEKGTNGTLISTAANGAQVGRWNSISEENSTRYSNISKVSGSLSFCADQSLSYGNGIETVFPSAQTKVYVSWWLYLPSGQPFPGEGGEGINWEQLSIMGGGSADDDLVMPTIMGYEDFYINGNDGIYSKWITLAFTKGTWSRLSCYLDGGSSNNGTVQYWELTGSGVQTRANDTNVTVLKSGGVFERVVVNGYGRQTDNCYPMFDDVYIAYGDGARARVEIGNNATYANCTNLTICTPTSWSTSSITATVRAGSFTNGTAYLFVTDASGVTSAGKKITFGSESPSTPSLRGVSLNGVNMR